MSKKRPALPAPILASSLPTADTLSAEEVFQLFSAVMALGEGLPGAALSRERQHALAGHVFAEAPEFVSAAARALSARAELFDDAPVDPEALLGRQRRALAWECVQNGLLHLAHWAGSLYIEDQAAAVQGAMALVEQVRADATRPFPHPRAAERRRALGWAEQVLADRQTRKRRAAARAERPAGPKVRKGGDGARALLREEARAQQAQVAASLGRPDAPSAP